MGPGFQPGSIYFLENLPNPRPLAGFAEGAGGLGAHPILLMGMGRVNTTHEKRYYFDGFGRSIDAGMVPGALNSARFKGTDPKAAAHLEELRRAFQRIGFFDDFQSGRTVAQE